MEKKEVEKYLSIMVDSLDKKKDCLEELMTKTVAQSRCIDGLGYDDVNWSQFEVLIIEKEAIIARVDEIDMGFDQIFSRVKSELDTNKKLYSDYIKALQNGITMLTDLGVNISAAEERNRKEIDRIMTAAKMGIGKARKNIRASSGYITSMYGGMMNVDSTSIDSKK